jgi:hypothetical protein
MGLCTAVLVALNLRFVLFHQSRENREALVSADENVIDMGPNTDMLGGQDLPGTEIQSALSPTRLRTQQTATDDTQSTDLQNAFDFDAGEKLISDRVDEFLAFLCTPIMRLMPQEYIDNIIDDIASGLDNMVGTWVINIFLS